MTKKSCPQLPINACLICSLVPHLWETLPCCLSFTRRTWYPFAAYHPHEEQGDASTYFYYKHIYFSFILPRASFHAVSYNLPFLLPCQLGPFLSSTSLICSATCFSVFLDFPLLALTHQPSWCLHRQHQQSSSPLTTQSLPHTPDPGLGLYHQGCTSSRTLNQCSHTQVIPDILKHIPITKACNKKI